MSVIDSRRSQGCLLDKRMVQELVKQQNEEVGFVPDPTATVEKAQALSRTLGVRPEDNLLSSGIIAAREE